MRLTAVLLAALVLLSTGPESRWTYAAGQHFEVYTTGGEAVARRAIEDFDRVHMYFELALKTPAITGPRTRLIVFSSRDEFAPYAANSSVKAFYQSDIDGDFIVLPGLKGDVMPAVTHEYAHLVARRTGSHYPLWLDDGLAEYFSTVMPAATKLLIGAAPPERQRALGFGVRLLPLERLFAVTRESADYTSPSRATLFYAESWALTHMLLSDERYRDKSGELLARLAKGEPSALALTTVYGKPVDDITKDLSKYALRGSYKATQLDIALPPMTAAADTRAASDFEAGVALASLLAANPTHRDDARAAFDALQSQNPNDLFFNESMATFLVRAGQFDQARAYLSRAVQLKSAKARIYIHLADVKLTSIDEKERLDADIDALYDTALALAPDDAEVRIQIARTLVERRKGAEALAMLAAITRVPIEYERVFAATLAAAMKVK